MPKRDDILMGPPIADDDDPHAAEIAAKRAGTDTQPPTDDDDPHAAEIAAKRAGTDTQPPTDDDNPHAAEIAAKRAGTDTQPPTDDDDPHAAEIAAKRAGGSERGDDLTQLADELVPRHEDADDTLSDVVARNDPDDLLDDGFD